MQIWVGVTLSCAALLIISGVPKLWNPDSTVLALRAVGVSRVGKRTARALTVSEIAIGAAAIAVGGRWADAGIALLYLGFSVFLIAALRGSTASCGCTGRDDTPPTVGHLMMTTLFAACSVAATVSGGRTGIMAVIQASDPARSITLLGYAALVTWLSWAILNLGARAQLRPQS
jgi:hypothetical protein